jgi:hypothetical protein
VRLCQSSGRFWEALEEGFLINRKYHRIIAFTMEVVKQLLIDICPVRVAVENEVARPILGSRSCMTYELH